MWGEGYIEACVNSGNERRDITRGKSAAGAATKQMPSHTARQASAPRRAAPHTHLHRNATVCVLIANEERLRGLGPRSSGL